MSEFSIDPAKINSLADQMRQEANQLNRAAVIIRNISSDLKVKDASMARVNNTLQNIGTKTSIQSSSLTQMVDTLRNIVTTYQSIEKTVSSLMNSNSGGSKSGNSASSSSRFVGTSGTQEKGKTISYGGATVTFNTQLFANPSSEYNNDLATLGAMLTKAAGDEQNDKSASEIRKLFYQMGVEDKNMENFNYGGENAFSIAHRTMMVDGVETNVIFVVARGTKVLREGMGDYFMRPNKGFQDQMAYNYVYDFNEKMQTAMRSYANGHPDLYGKPAVFSISGYSLGGAAANLFGATANHPESANSWIFHQTDPSRIHVYTYGAIDSIKSDHTIEKGYENIHNIYNTYDTYGPYGRKTWTTSGNSGTGKYGQIHFLDFQNSNIDMNHDIGNYLHGIVEGKVKE